MIGKQLAVGSTRLAVEEKASSIDYFLSWFPGVTKEQVDAVLACGACEIELATGAAKRNL